VAAKCFMEGFREISFLGPPPQVDESWKKRGEAPPVPWMRSRTGWWRAVDSRCSSCFTLWRTSGLGRNISCKPGQLCVCLEAGTAVSGHAKSGGGWPGLPVEVIWRPRVLPGLAL